MRKKDSNKKGMEVNFLRPGEKLKLSEWCEDNDIENRTDDFMEEVNDIIYRAVYNAGFEWRARHKYKLGTPKARSKETRIECDRAVQLLESLSGDIKGPLALCDHDRGTEALSVYKLLLADLKKVRLDLDGELAPEAEWGALKSDLVDGVYLLAIHYGIKMTSTINGDLVLILNIIQSAVVGCIVRNNLSYTYNKVPFNSHEISKKIVKKYRNK